MPYSNERSPRLGHVPVVNNAAVAAALARWEITHARPNDSHSIQALCKPLEALPSLTVASSISFAITVDGSDVEVEATRHYPTVKVGYLRIAGSFVDLSKLLRVNAEPFVDPAKVRESHSESSIDAALPGSGLTIAGLTGVETWRRELNRFLASTRFDEDSTLTLADTLLTMFGHPGSPVTAIGLGTCPVCREHDYSGQRPIRVTKEGSECPFCKSEVYLSDVLRTHEEYAPEGSNQTALTRVMLIAERLMTLSYLDHIYTQTPRPEEVFKQTIFITDGPLALFGVVAPLKRRLYSYNEALFRWADSRGVVAPLLVGIEKTGRFVEHAELIIDLIPRGHVMMLSSEYINRITGRPVDNVYGKDEFYGRRFIYRTTAGDPLVITVPPRPGVLPYEGSGAESFDSYPTLRTVCEVLDSVRTRLYPNAVIPVALAHTAASLPLGIGQSVLRAMAQRGIGIPQDTQMRQRTHRH